MFPSTIVTVLSVCMLLAACHSVAANAWVCGSQYEDNGFRSPIFLSVLAVLFAPMVRRSKKDGLIGKLGLR